MKIKKISCEQFAGIRDADITFSDGINVVYGKNESGKSTLVNLLSRTLFQKAELDRRSDRGFIDLYFPVVQKGGREIKAVDGKIKFETEKGEYTLSKIWGEGTGCSLSMPEGVIRDQSRIDEILREVLGYGEGVYSDMLFSSQRNTDLSLQTILDATKKTDAKQEIAAAVTKAFAESDGLPVDVIGQAIMEKIDKIAGSHWESEKGVPSKKSGGGRWEKGIGEIHKAYYTLEDKREVLDRITALEQEVDRATADYEAKNAEAEDAENKYRSFDKYASRLIVQNALNDKLSGLKKDISRYTEILDNWPIYEGQLQNARALQAEKLNRELLDKYSAAKQIFDSMNELKAFQSKLLCPSEQEIVGAKSAQLKVIGLESKLCGMNVAATVKMFGGNSVEIKSLRTGEIIDVTGDNVSITEAVNIAVPGVMEMQLAPADVDITSIESQIREQNLIICSIFGKYGVDNVEDLAALAKQFADCERQIKTSEERLDLSLGDTDFEELEKNAKAIPADIRSKEEISSEIFALCGRVDISSFIAAKAAILDGYIKEYGNLDALKERLRQANEEFTATEKSMGNAEVPAEYLNIKDPENHRKILQTSLEFKQKDREKALTEKTRANTALDNYKEGLSGDPLADVERAERDFNEQKTLLAHWQHILEVFQKQKESISGNPMQDISDSFTKYLGIISGGNISSEFREQDKLDMDIYSHNRPVDYVKLSEGSKETVSLAFRLAVLDHLFPDGGGVIVLDDPFTDMDDNRTAQACRLIAECATRHQVIFLTCKQEYATMLGGNTIKIG